MFFAIIHNPSDHRVALFPDRAKVTFRDNEGGKYSVESLF